MSIDIGAVGSATGIERAQRYATRSPAGPDGASGIDDAVEIDMIPSSPPPEVLDAIAKAAAAYDKLAASGRHVHFAVDRPTGRLAVQIQDRAGNTLSTITGAQALDLAAGDDITSHGGDTWPSAGR